ncbi:AAA family ATPase [Pseudomonas frederiksbergensis]|uniref:AAA family ATPase n=1 Tax=Pseudomonas frederiksbergensis TaxID=104087 RepID=UPI003D22E0D7
MNSHSLNPNSTPVFDNFPAPHNDANATPQAPLHPGPEQVGNGQPLAPQPERWANIAVTLRERAQWCVAGADKSPWTVTGQRASSTKPETWSDFDAACRAAAEKGLHIGYMLHEKDPFTCIDMDVKDDTPQEHIDRFHEIIKSADSYTERSRSGKGFHVWIEGKVGKGRRRDGVEVYSQERFIICTGDVLVDKPITEKFELLEILIAEMSQGSQPEADLYALGDDSEAAYVARQAMDEEGCFLDNEFGRLAAGDWQGRYQSASEADLALVKLLARHSDLDGSVWVAFQMFPLGKRVKDDRVKSERPDYRRRTLMLARQHLASDAEQVAQGRAMAESMLRPIANPRHFRLLSDSDLAQLPPQSWLVKGIIPNASVGTIFGQSGTFKSFLALDLMAHIANGQHWFGRRVIAAPAVYVPFEGQGGIPKRVAAWRLARVHQGCGDATTNMRFITDRMNLRLQADRDKLVTTLRERGWAGGVLCIDTLAQAGAGIDENSSEGMGEMIAIFQELQHSLGGVVLVIHHSGKVESAGMRGWSGLRGALDFSIKCQEDKAEGKSKYDAQFVLDKVKDGRDGEAFSFAMLCVHLGYDADGDEISSLTVNQPATPTRVEASSRSDATRDMEDDEFVWQWVNQEEAKGEYPTGRSLEGQREEQMRPQRDIAQKRLRNAIHRLKAASRLVDSEVNAPSGSKWLHAVDAPTYATSE